MYPEINNRQGTVKVYAPQIMLILYGGFILETAGLIFLYRMQLHAVELIEKPTFHQHLLTICLSILGTGFLFSGTHFKRIKRGKSVIHLVLSVLFLAFVAVYMYHDTIALTPKNVNVPENVMDMVIDYLYLILLLLHLLVPLIIIGVHIIRIEKRSKSLDETY